MSWSRDAPESPHNFGKLDPSSIIASLTRPRCAFVSHTMMATMMTRALLFLLLFTASAAATQTECEFEVHMFSNASSNDCFEGWPLKKAADLAHPVLKSWREKEYPETISPADRFYGLYTLTHDEYKELEGDAKKEYEQAHKNAGWSAAYDKRYPFCKDKGYRAGWQKEYTNKLSASDETDRKSVV